jgi:hypothetical protein
MNNASSFPWTGEQVDLLKKLWMDGLSASQISGELGGGLSRNAVIGKLHRIGLTERDRLGLPKTQKVRAPRKKRIRKFARKPPTPIVDTPDVATEATALPAEHVPGRSASHARRTSASAASVGRGKPPKAVKFHTACIIAAWPTSRARNGATGARKSTWQGARREQPRNQHRYGARSVERASRDPTRS